MLARAFYTYIPTYRGSRASYRMQYILYTYVASKYNQHNNTRSQSARFVRSAAYPDRVEVLVNETDRQTDRQDIETLKHLVGFPHLFDVQEIHSERIVQRFVDQKIKVSGC